MTFEPAFSAAPYAGARGKPGTAHIPLTKGMIALVDARHAEALRAMGSWHVTTEGYARRYRCDDEGKRVAQHMHHEVLRLEGISLEGLETDHENGDTLDCRASNLRTCTHQQNTFNRKKRCDGVTSRFKGVCRDRRGKFVAGIRFNGRRIHLGTFSLEEDAGAAYAAAARRLFGAFATTRSSDPTPSVPGGDSRVTTKSTRGHSYWSGCRCAECKADKAAYDRRWRARRKTAAAISGVT